MREKNTHEPQTDFYFQGKLLLLAAALLIFLVGGCGGAGLSAKNIWKNTKKSVSDTLISISKYQRESAKKKRNSGKTRAVTTKGQSAQDERKPGTRPTEARPFQDRFPSRGHSPREEGLTPGKTRRASERTMRGEGSKGALLIPRTTMGPDELRQRIQDIKQEEMLAKNPSRKRRLAQERRRLEQTLLKSRKEEGIIKEMEQLRERLRELQKDLLEIQQAER